MKHLKGIVFVLTVLLTMSWISLTQAADIVIGFTGPLSGPAGEFGQDCVNGLDMAINELNAAGGITVEGQKLLFRLEKLEDRLDPNQLIINAHQLLEKNALVIYSPLVPPLMKINQDECKEFILMGYAVELKSGRMGNKLMISMNPPLTICVQLLADMAWERGWRKVAMVVMLSAYGDEWRENFQAYWKKLGGTVTADKPANYFTKTDYTAPLAAALATNPDVMLIGGPSATTALVLEQARNMGYKGGFLIIDGAKMDYIAQILDGTSLMENTYGALGMANSPALAAPAFIKKYRAAYKRPPTVEASTHYDSMYSLAKAISAANTVDDVYAIRAAFPNAFPLLSDKFTNESYGISSAGRVQMMVGVQSIKNGKFTQPEMYVWWAKTQAEFDKVQKVTKFTAPLKWFKSKIGNVE